MVMTPEQVADLDWHSEVEAPRVVGASEKLDWFADADVVVVGRGGAGVSAALQAAEEGASVIALDRFNGGGSAAVNGGIFYAGGGTAPQREAGVEDSIEDWR